MTSLDRPIFILNLLITTISAGKHDMRNPDILLSKLATKDLFYQSKLQVAKYPRKQMKH